MLGYMDMVVAFASYLAAKEVMERMFPSKPVMTAAVPLPAARASVGVKSVLATKSEQEECEGQCFGLDTEIADSVTAAASAPAVEFEVSLQCPAEAASSLRKSMADFMTRAMDIGR